MHAASAPVLRVTGASLVRGDAQVLHSISFTLHPGEHAAILGPNGSGKSSLLKLLTLDAHPLATAAHPDSVQWFGQPRMTRAELSRRVGVVSADLDAGFARMSAGGRVTVLDAVVSGFLGTEGVFAHQSVEAGQQAAAREALARAGLPGVESRWLSGLSVGERRRVLIARALVARPELLLLDEPTSGLDLVARHAFLDAMREACRAGTTLLLVTHHVEEVIPECQRVLLLREGRLLADGPRPEVLTGPMLSRAFGQAIEVVEVSGHSRAHVMTQPSPGPDGRSGL